MFDPNGPLDPDVCDEILIAVARKGNERKEQLKARIVCLAEELCYEKAEVKNNAEYLIMTGHLVGRLGGFLRLTREGARVATLLLEELEEPEY